MKIFLCAIFGLAFFHSSAQDFKKYNSLKTKGDSLYRLKDYHGAAVTYSEMIKAADGRADIGDYYRGAFTYALLGNRDSAFYYLGKISLLNNFSFSEYLDVVDDRDFREIRSDSRWKEVNKKMFAIANNNFYSELPSKKDKDLISLLINSASAWAYNNEPDSAFVQLFQIANLNSLTISNSDAIIKEGYLKPLHTDRRWKELIDKLTLSTDLNLYKDLLSELKRNGIDISIDNQEQVKFAKVLTHNPDGFFAQLNNQASVFIKQKRYQDALIFIEASDHVFPNNYWVQQDFGNYYWKTGDKQKAFQYYAKALNLKYFVSSIRTNTKNLDSSINLDYAKLFEKFNKRRIGKKVVIDEGHYNFHTSWGSYAPYANLLRENGFDVNSNGGKFTTEVLANTDVLIVASPASDFMDSLNKKAMNANEPPRFSAITTKSAFSEKEVTVVKNWVSNGGSLLLIIDHAPHPKISESLANAFGIETRNVNTYDSLVKDITVKTPTILFTKYNNLLGKHPILKQVDSVTTYTGSSIKGPKDSDPLLILPNTVIDQDIDLSTKKQRFYSGAGRSQALALEFGKGRVVLVAEAGMFTSTPGLGKYSIGSEGIARKDRGNRQFALNVVKWLSHINP